MAVPGEKTGMDAIYQNIYHICRLITKYQGKIALLLAAAKAADIISEAEETVVNTALNAIVAACAIFEKLAKFNSTG